VNRDSSLDLTDDYRFRKSVAHYILYSLVGESYNVSVRGGRFRVPLYRVLRSIIIFIIMTIRVSVGGGCPILPGHAVPRVSPNGLACPSALRVSGGAYGDGDIWWK
jgi:hypothetical protein